MLMSSNVSPPDWPRQDPPDRRVNPFVVALLRCDPLAREFLGDPVIRQSVTPQSSGHADGRDPGQIEGIENWRVREGHRTRI